MTFTNRLSRGNGRRAASLAIFGFAAALVSAACQQGSSGPFSSLSTAPSSLADKPDTPPGQDGKYYKASIAPNTAIAGDTAVEFVVTITNCGTCEGGVTSGTSGSIKSATVTIPSGITNVTVVSAVPSNGGTWTAVLDGNTIKVNKDSGNDSLDPGQSVAITFTADVACDPGVRTFQTHAYNGDDYTTDFTIAGPQPVVTVFAGDCGTAEECPAAPSIAAHYLKDQGVTPNDNVYKNIVAQVADHMGTGATFDGLDKCDPGYAAAVIAFVQGLL